MFDHIKNKTLFVNRYKTNSEAIIVSCFFNPQNSPYRTSAFKHFYESIKHLNHQIIECVIGDAKPELQESKNIKRVFTKNLLWHKESLLNKLISELPDNYKYVFWLDADVIFTNLNWLTEGVEQLKYNNIIQPFEHCVHLEKDENVPSFSMDKLKEADLPNQINNKVWRSFSASYATSELWKDEDYNNHGHVGFAWGAKLEILKAVPLYEKALIGGADHIIAHAAAGQIAHSCITKSFTDNIEEVNQWSKQFFNVVKGNIGFVKGDLYHIWHGDIEKREYLKRIQDFTAQSKNIVNRDKNGLYVTNQNDDIYMTDYFKHREVSNNHDFSSPIFSDVIFGTAIIAGTVVETITDILTDKDQSKQEFEEFVGRAINEVGAGAGRGNNVISVKKINDNLKSHSNSDNFS